jgi:stage II sporulation protein M
LRKNPFGSDVWKFTGALLLTFLGAAFFGYFYSTQNPEVTARIIELLRRKIGPLPSPGIQMFLRIFLNNTVVALFSMISGLFFGLGPWFIMGFNGFIAGVVAGFVVEDGGYSLSKVLFALLPHGIVEIPALAIAGAAGIIWYRSILYGREKSEEGFKKGFIRAFALFVVSVVLLFFAALIETYVTPKLSGL